MELVKKSCDNRTCEKLYDTTLPIQVYVTYSYPDDIIGIAVSFSKEFKIDVTSLSNLSELKLDSSSTHQCLDKNAPCSANEE